MRMSGLVFIFSDVIIGTLRVKSLRLEFFWLRELILVMVHTVDRYPENSSFWKWNSSNFDIFISHIP